MNEQSFLTRNKPFIICEKVFVAKIIFFPRDELENVVVSLCFPLLEKVSLLYKGPGTPYRDSVVGEITPLTDYIQ